MELPVVNHPDYEAKIGDDNKFPIKKFGELASFLKKETFLAPGKSFASNISSEP